MLRLDWTGLFCRTIPEIFILVYGIILLSQGDIRINIWKYIIYSLFLSISTFLVRWLPIYFGVHMIINVILIISIMSIIGISVIKAIYSTLFMFFILSLSEFLNICILDLFNIRMFEDIDSFQKNLYGMPSLFIMIIFLLIIGYILKKKEEKENVNNRKNSS